MNLKSLIPVGRERNVAHPDFFSFTSLKNEIDRLFDNFHLGSVGAGTLVPSTDLAETDTTIEITAELPGLEEKDVQINVADNILTIKGEKKAEKEEKDKNYRMVERSFGSFYRSVELPAGTDVDKIKATLSKGVLKVVVPKAASAQVKKVEVKAAA
ncbi:MAG: Hsp20/alpha crystallin family protein [Pseudorhodoplanes sp.]|nr:Hsp20/alpha crystallin family protein [Pseudorhodoplanes sp.]